MPAFPVEISPVVNTFSQGATQVRALDGIDLKIPGGEFHGRVRLGK
jgi:hypothetical protein